MHVSLQRNTCLFVTDQPVQAGVLREIPQMLRLFAQKRGFYGTKRALWRCEGVQRVCVRTTITASSITEEIEPPSAKP
jgi:hypothetical protein